MAAGQLAGSSPWASQRRWLTALLLLALSAFAAGLQSEFRRADGIAYFAYLRSAALDRDLDFTNEWMRYGYEPTSLTATGHRSNVQSIGPAILWSPFFAVAHAYVLLTNSLGLATGPADGYSAPYWRAVGFGTAFVAFLGAVLLTITINRRIDRRLGLLAVSLTALASFIMYYIFVLPTMAHGVAFGISSAALWALDRAENEGTRRRWLELGGLLGLLCLVRWQAVVLGLLPALVAVRQLVLRRVKAIDLLLALGAGVVVFSPQLLVWRVLFGSFFTLPQGSGFFNWRSPHAADVLLSADHGLLTWSPIALIGVLGLALWMRTDRVWALGALGVFVANVYVCGAARDWAGSDAFGARRFDFVVALLAIGVGVAIRSFERTAQRRPLLVPATAGLALVLWNLAFASAFKSGAFPSAAPMDRVVATQALAARHALGLALGGLAGDRGRALAYKITVGEYFYTNVNPGGSIEVGAVNSPFLMEGWSKIRLRSDGPQFRWALSPRACVRIPLEEPIELRGYVSARSVGAEPSSVDLLVNGKPIAALRLVPQWKDLAFSAPAKLLLPGENFLCLRAPAPTGTAEPVAIAAVSLIQLP